MWEKLRVVFTIPELRQKIFLTLLLPGHLSGRLLDLSADGRPEQVAAVSTSGTGGLADIINQVAVFSASDLTQATIFGLGIMPYISASIIFQLLGSVWKPIEELKKEGETGRKKINEYTRYLTVVLCLIQSYFYVKFWLLRESSDGGNLIAEAFRNANGTLSVGWQLTAVLTMTCGTIFLMWIGEQIDEFGIGNGISLLIMAGILARMPGALWDLLVNQAEFELVGIGPGRIGVESLLVLAALFVAVVVGVVFITLGQRRIPTQSAKHVRGRRVYGGTRQYPAAADQPGRCDADHFRQQLADAARHAVQHDDQLADERGLGAVLQLPGLDVFPRHIGASTTCCTSC